MFVATSEWSAISLEAWFLRNWTGRFLSTENGGLSGCIQYEDLAYTAALGFATVGANNGHNGTSGAPFLDNLDVFEDFSFRYMHTGVVVGKNPTKTFYGSPYTKSYYLGCSTGGRQGLKSVQDFPEDFDGVVAGKYQSDEYDVYYGGSSWDDQEHIQIEGQFAYPRMQPGSEDVPFYYNGAPSTYTSDWFRYVVYNDPNFDVTTLSDKVVLIRISGMHHCSGGPGAWEIGQTLAGSGGNSNYLMDLDLESNVLMAMVRWVEEGIAPETVLGTKIMNDTVANGVQFLRAHCRYPLRNTYDGVGDPTKKESWNCLEVDSDS
ncbi:tannase-domain-containing protein [Dendrothele bispora CBS 962.96]|uniref:Carboxylic ester hydrolase n=1 Tax=Dendrothele bispora (strain CBS 962.96) TaxID=1314807 RepID=A0A4V4HEW1_DENBC|nr:tannase-domain-containing protein [Dendrothele bispora CBS 962.96]